jgi:membrane-associated phospholipid phosphatase
MRSPARSFAFASMLALYAIGSRASAQQVGIHDLRYDVPVDVTVAASAGALWAASEIFHSSLAPSSCRWCDRNADGSDALNGVDASVRSGLKWSDTDTPGTISDWAAYAVAPMAAVGLDALAAHHDDGTVQQAAVDALIIAQSSFLAADLCQIAKIAAGRERPFVHALPPGEKRLTDNPSDNNVSFFSSHTAWTFALAASSGTVASLRGYRLAPLVWAVGTPIAAVTGYLRIAADKHYFTDVAVGALVGAAVGVTVPLLAHAREGRDAATPSVTASASPLAISFAGVF